MPKFLQRAAIINLISERSSESAKTFTQYCFQATYTHRFDFSVQSIVQTVDTADFSNGRPLQIIDGVFTDKDLEYNVNTRS